MAPALFLCRQTQHRRPVSPRSRGRGVPRGVPSYGLLVLCVFPGRLQVHQDSLAILIRKKSCGSGGALASW